MSAATRAAYTTYALATLAVVTAAVLLMVNGLRFLTALAVVAALAVPIAVIAFGVFTLLARGRAGKAAEGTRNAVGSAAAAMIALCSFWVSVIAAAAIGVASFVARLINSVTNALGLSLEISTGNASTVAVIGAALAVVTAVGAVTTAAAALAASGEDR